MTGDCRYCRGAGVIVYGNGRGTMGTCPMCEGGRTRVKGMTMREAEREWRELAREIDWSDKPARRESWCVFIDSLVRDGRATEQQVAGLGATARERVNVCLPL